MGKNKAETMRAWRQRNPDKVKAYKKKYYADHPEEAKGRNRRYYEKNQEKLLTQKRERHRESHDAIIAKQRARRAANPEKFRKMNADHRRANPHLWRLYGARKAAKNAGVACDLDGEWFKSRLDAGVCELSGLPFDLKEKYGLGGRGPNSASVDRRNPKGPYTKENCRLILWWLNRAFSDLGDEYPFAVFRAIFIKRGEMLDYEDRQAA